MIEQISGDPWDGYVQKNIFAPLGLDRSYFRSTPYFLAEHRSHNYYVRKDSSGRVDVTDNGADFDPGIWMGLSYFVLDHDGVRMLGHTGSQAGFRSFFYFNPANGSAIVAAFNTTNYASAALAVERQLNNAALDLLK